MTIPQPELTKLSADWFPWKYQVKVFGDPKTYGSSSKTPIICGVSNFENVADAEKAFYKALAKWSA